jgi:IS30 family transposase
LSTQVERLNLEWRRSKVLELNSQGYSQPEIAKTLQVSLGTINRDLSIVRQQAKENLQKHIQEKLPEEYQRCLTGFNQVLKTCWSIINKPYADDKTKLQATAIINDSYKYIMDLTTNGVVVTDAIKYVQANKEKLTTMSNKEDNDQESEEPDYNKDGDQLEEETGELSKTTNQVF